MSDKIERLLESMKPQDITTMNRDRVVANKYESEYVKNNGILLPQTEATSEYAIFERLGKPFIVHKYIRKCDKHKINHELSTFISCSPPYGCMPKIIAAHALLDYAMHGAFIYHTNKENRQQLEGERDLFLDFRALFISYSIRYDVECEDMDKYWHPVKLTFKSLFGKKSAVPDPVWKAQRFNFDQARETSKLYHGEYNDE